MAAIIAALAIGMAIGILIGWQLCVNAVAGALHEVAVAMRQGAQHGDTLLIWAEALDQALVTLGLHRG